MATNRSGNITQHKHGTNGQPGSYGIVKKCMHKTKGNVYAAKIIKTGNNTIRKTVLREIEVMRELGPHNKTCGVGRCLSDAI
ncbi:hypothetical protein OS493_010856 [Desmophyllum pertusum]|uniref:Protein kinase domain-containing protein n=1 Tax=Desmophyllum pertusum TaxID=174260 RepID=A0A9X0CYE7_9CNID|nr:hypothetical protein OS493_010856 [Desmophyllum pertusum]